jgi:two-component system, NarL family, sensor kinase
LEKAGRPPLNLDSHPTDSAAEQAARHPHQAERELAWMRHACLLFWGAALYYGGYPIRFSPAWITYSCGVGYTLLLHWQLRNRRHIQFKAMIGTIADPVLTFCICFVSGGLHSIFVPFFYFTVLSAAFRYGVRETIGMLLLNGSLVGLLYYSKQDGVDYTEALLLAYVYLGFATGLGALLAGWARANLRIALTQSDALRTERDRTNALLHRLIDNQEEQRRQMAGDLHDRMSGRLFALTHGLEECAAHVGPNATLQRRLDSVRAAANACGSEVRALMNDLWPTVLDELGFFEALNEYLIGLRGSVPFRLDIRLDPRLQQWRSRQDAMLFRLVQEALLNARKHARARQLTVTLETRADHVLLSIADDGRGFDAASIPAGHYGLLTMRERANSCGGSLSVTSQVGRGTCISISLPLELNE